MSQTPTNLHIATDESEAENVGRPEFVTLADKLSADQIEEVAYLALRLKEVRETNLRADQAVELLGNHIDTLMAVFEAVVPLIQRRLENYNGGSTQTLGATASAQGVQGVLGKIVGPALLNLRDQLPLLQGFLQTVGAATSPPALTEGDA